MLTSSAQAVPSDPLVVELNRLLARGGADAVNEQLSANWETKSARLGKLTEKCEPDALKLSVDLLVTTNLEALAGHHYSLQAAMGRCPQKLLTITSDNQIKEICSISAYIEANPNKDPVRELTRRLDNLRRLGLVKKLTKGDRCAQAYEQQKRELAK